EIRRAHAERDHLLVGLDRFLEAAVKVGVVAAVEGRALRGGELAVGGERRRRDQEQREDEAFHAASFSLTVLTCSIQPSSVRTRRRAARISPGPDADGAKRAKSQFSSSRTTASAVSLAKPRCSRKVRSS